MFAALLCTILLIIWHYNSKISLPLRNGREIRIVVLTVPPAVIAYNPENMKASVFFAGEITGQTSSGSNLQEAAAVMAGVAQSSGAAYAPVYYFMPPGKKEWRDFRDLSKEWLAAWKTNPLMLAKYFSGYLKAYLSGNSNIPTPDFLTLTLELTRLQAVDFSLPLNESGKTASANMPQAQSAAVSNTLVVEVLNATGKKGIALEVTKYLRSLNERGIQKIDVLHYDNYRKTEPKSRIIGHTGRLEELSRLSSRLGLTSSEILSDKSKFAYTDATIIIGEDFSLPRSR